MFHFDSFHYASLYTSLVKFIPKYFIKFDAIVNGIVCSLLVCKIQLRIELVSCNLAELIYSNTFCVDSLGLF